MDRPQRCDGCGASVDPRVWVHCPVCGCARMRPAGDGDGEGFAVEWGPAGGAVAHPDPVGRPHPRVGAARAA